MAWVKIPKENHALFYARLPKDARIQTLQMFGAAAAKVNGHLFGGLFARSFMVKLGDAEHATALALDGAERFDPMGNGRVMSNSVLMPESLMDEPAEMTAWLQKALDYAATLPPKVAKGAKAKTASTSKPIAKSTTTPSKSSSAAKSASKTKTPSKSSSAAKSASKTKTPSRSSSTAKSASKTRAPSKSAPTAKLRRR